MLPAAEELPREARFEDEVSAVRIERIRRGRGGQTPQVWLRRIPGEKSLGLPGESIRCYRLAKAYLVQHIAAAFGIRPERVYCPKWMVTTRYEIYFELEHGGNFARDALKRILMEQFGIKVEQRQAVIPTLVLASLDGSTRPARSERASCKNTVAPNVAAPASTRVGIAELPSPDPVQPGWGGGPNPVNFHLGCEVAEIVPALERQFQREVFDETGLTGRFDFRIPTPASLKSVNRHLEKQIGVKLSEQPRELDVLVVVSGKKL